jgi:hypothetical protein
MSADYHRFVTGIWIFVIGSNTLIRRAYQSVARVVQPATVMIRHLDIPKERWNSFLQIFDRQVDGRSIRIELIGRELGDQLGNRLPLRGIDYEPKGSEAGSILVTVEGPGGDLTHHIGDTVRIYLGQNSENGEFEWLAIEEADGVKTIIHFEHLPELQAPLTP